MMDQPCVIGQHQELRLLNERRFFTTIFIVSCITLLTLQPIVIFDTLSGKAYYMRDVNSSSLSGVIRFFLVTLCIVNSLINPFVYSWRLTKYRKTLAIVIKKIELLAHINVDNFKISGVDEPQYSKIFTEEMKFPISARGIN